jgi:hypothetical protein
LALGVVVGRQQVLAEREAWAVVVILVLVAQQEQH